MLDNINLYRDPRPFTLDGLRDAKLDGLPDAKLDGLPDAKLDGLRDAKLDGLRDAKSIIDKLEKYPYEKYPYEEGEKNLKSSFFDLDRTVFVGQLPFHKKPSEINYLANMILTGLKVLFGVNCSKKDITGFFCNSLHESWAKIEFSSSGLRDLVTKLNDCIFIDQELVNGRETVFFRIAKTPKEKEALHLYLTLKACLRPFGKLVPYCPIKFEPAQHGRIVRSAEPASNERTEYLKNFCAMFSKPKGIVLSLKTPSNFEQTPPPFFHKCPSDSHNFDPLRTIVIKNYPPDLNNEECLAYNLTKLMFPNNQEYLSTSFITALSFSNIDESIMVEFLSTDLKNLALKLCGRVFFEYGYGICFNQLLIKAHILENDPRQGEFEFYQELRKIVNPIGFPMLSCKPLVVVDAEPYLKRTVRTNVMRRGRGRGLEATRGPESTQLI